MCDIQSFFKTTKIQNPKIKNRKNKKQNKKYISSLFFLFSFFFSPSFDSSSPCCFFYSSFVKNIIYSCNATYRCFFFWFDDMNLSNRIKVCVWKFLFCRIFFKKDGKNEQSRTRKSLFSISFGKRSRKKSSYYRFASFAYSTIVFERNIVNYVLELFSSIMTQCCFFKSTFTLLKILL